MRIISWNRGGKFRDKFKIIIQLKADIYIIQECENPKTTKEKNIQHGQKIIDGLEKDNNKGLGIFAREGIILTDLNWNSLCLNFFLPVKVNDGFDLLGVWTQNPYIEEYYIYQQLNKEYYSDKTILFGDFNSNKRFDSKYITRKEREHEPTIKELKDIGLEDAYHYITKEKQGEESKNTFYLYRHKNKGFYINHCLISPMYLKTYEILDDEKWLAYSDHVPCILETK